MIDVKYNYPSYQRKFSTEADPENLHRGGQTDCGHFHMLRQRHKRGQAGGAK